MSMRIGHGYDVHRFEAGSGVTLGGIYIDHDKSLAAHSDGDVLVHAICDALLGAIAGGDIGRHFPDTDAANENIDSRILLRRVMALVNEVIVGAGRDWRHPGGAVTLPRRGGGQLVCMVSPMAPENSAALLAPEGRALVYFHAPEYEGAVDEGQIAAFEERMDEQGYLDGCAMSNSSSSLTFIAPFVHMIHSIDSLRLLKEVNKEAKKNIFASLISIESFTLSI